MGFVTTLNVDLLGFISTVPRASLFFIPDYVVLHTVKWMQKHITGKEVTFIQMLLRDIRL
jgi:hypothetical protein